MLTNFIFNLPFCRRACRSGIASSEISSPLSWKHIGAEFASCRPPLPSAAIILRPHPALWPASLPGTGAPLKIKRWFFSIQAIIIRLTPPSPPHPIPFTLIQTMQAGQPRCSRKTPHAFVAMKACHTQGRALALQILIVPLMWPYANLSTPPSSSCNMSVSAERQTINTLQLIIPPS